MRLSSTNLFKILYLNALPLAVSNTCVVYYRLGFRQLVEYHIIIKYKMCSSVVGSTLRGRRLCKFIFCIVTLTQNYL